MKLQENGNCVANCARWKEKQQQKQQEVDTMKAEFEKARKQLEQIEELARNDEGFGSALCDPQEQPSGRQAAEQFS